MSTPGRDGGGQVSAHEAENTHLKEHATYLAQQANDLARERDALKAHVRTLREALEFARQAMSNAIYRLKNPDMGGQYVPRAREKLEDDVRQVRAALAATEVSE